MSVILPGLAMFTIATTLMMTIRMRVMVLARQAENPSSITTCSRQRGQQRQQLGDPR